MTAQDFSATCVQNTYYRDADSDTYGNVSLPTQACPQPPGYVTNSSDCNDGNAFINPGTAEVCNGVDDNCNGQVDEGCLTLTVSAIAVCSNVLPQGATNQSITITGDGFEAGATVSFSGSGVVVNTVVFMNSNQLNVNSLLVSLNNANKTLDRNAISATKGILNALINKLDGYLKGNKISSVVKDCLEIEINALISSL